MKFACDATRLVDGSPCRCLTFKEWLSNKLYDLHEYLQEKLNV